MTDSLDEAFQRHARRAEFTAEQRSHHEAEDERLLDEIVTLLRDFLIRAQELGFPRLEEVKFERGWRAKAHKVWAVRCTSMRSGTPRVIWLKPDGTIAAQQVHKNQLVTKWLPLESGVRHVSEVTKTRIEKEALEDSLVQILTGKHPSPKWF